MDDSTGVVESASMFFMTSTRHPSWSEVLVVYLVLFGVCAVLFALIKWKCGEQTRKVLLATGWLVLMAGVLDFGLRLSGLLGYRAMTAGRDSVASVAMWWWDLRGSVLFFCLPLLSAMMAFMFASLIGTRAGPAEKR